MLATMLIIITSSYRESFQATSAKESDVWQFDFGNQHVWLTDWYHFFPM